MTDKRKLPWVVIHAPDIVLVVVCVAAAWVFVPKVVPGEVPVGVTQDPLSCEVVAAKVSPNRVFLPNGKRLPDTVMEGARFMNFGMAEVRQTVLTLRAENRLSMPVEVMAYCDQTRWESGTDHSTSKDFNVISTGHMGLSQPLPTGGATEMKMTVNSDPEVEAPWFKCFCSFRVDRRTAAGRIGP